MVQSKKHVLMSTMPCDISLVLSSRATASMGQCSSTHRPQEDGRRLHTIRTSSSSWWSRVCGYCCCWYKSRPVRDHDQHGGDDDGDGDGSGFGGADPPGQEVHDLAYWKRQHALLTSKMENSSVGQRFQQEWHDPQIGHQHMVGGMIMSTLPPSWNALAESKTMKELQHAERMIANLGGSVYDD